MSVCSHNSAGDVKCALCAAEQAKKLDLSAYAPCVGDTVTYDGKQGTVTLIEGDVAEVDYNDGRSPTEAAFIWKFVNGLNSIHDWPGKSGDVVPATTLLCRPMDGWPAEWRGRNVRVVDGKITTKAELDSPVAI